MPLKEKQSVKKYFLWRADTILYNEWRAAAAAAAAAGCVVLEEGGRRGSHVLFSWLPRQQQAAFFKRPPPLPPSFLPPLSFTFSSFLVQSKQNQTQHHHIYFFTFLSTALARRLPGPENRLCSERIWDAYERVEALQKLLALLFPGQILQITGVYKIFAGQTSQVLAAS